MHSILVRGSKIGRIVTGRIEHKRLNLLMKMKRHVDVHDAVGGNISA